jgi:hypothetical protein
VGHDTGAKEWCTRAALGASRLIPLAKARRWLVSDSPPRVKVGIRHTHVFGIVICMFQNVFGLVDIAPKFPPPQVYHG